jgi:hypothetical protein
MAWLNPLYFQAWHEKTTGAWNYDHAGIRQSVDGKLYLEDVSRSDTVEKGLEVLNLLTATEVAAEPTS